MDSPTTSHLHTPILSDTDDDSQVLNTSSPTLSFRDKKCSIDESLIYHARKGNAAVVADLLDSRRRGEIDLNINHLGILKWDRGCSALHIASYFGHVEVVKFLATDSDCNLDIRNNHWETPLHKAALTGRIDIVRVLIDEGASVLMTDDKGRRASEIKSVSAEMKALLKEMEQVQSANQANRFLQACRQGSVEKMRNLLGSGHPPSLHYTDDQGNTALHHAVRCDQKEAASVLLEHASDPHRKNAQGQTCFDLIISDHMRRILEIKPPLKFGPKCQPLEGMLLKANRIWNLWRKNWVVLNRGTISLYRSKKDVGNERSRRAYKHLDGAQVKACRRWSEFDMAFSDGTKISLRVPKATDIKYRDHWIERIKEHISYSDHYIGVPPKKSQESATSGQQNAESSLLDVKQRLEDLKKAVVQALSGRRLSGAVTEAGQVTDAADAVYAAVQVCFDMLQEQDKMKQQLLGEERERCRVLENALEVLATEHEAMLTSVEMLGSTGSLNSGHSVYYSPPESIADLEEFRSNDNRPLLTPTDSVEEEDDEDEFHDTTFEEGHSVGTMPGDMGNSDLLTDDSSGTVAKTYANGHGKHLEQNGDVIPKRSKFGARTTLPVQQFSRTDFSIWSVLKQCIGKDLSKITMPVVFNEPLSFLQRMSEYMEYAQLLDQAGMCDDPVERICFVAAFAVSACASNADRIGKPFNPILGETYELSRPELGYRMISEQVSHHPPISAFNASSDTWNFGGSILPKLKFWGKSVEIQPKGVVTLKLAKFNETYTWSNVNCHVNNIIVGKLWIEQYGTMDIVNHTNGLSVVLNFHPTGWTNRELHKVNGFVLDKSKQQVKAIYGKWTDYLRSVDVKTFQNFTKNGPNKSLSVDQNRPRRATSMERESGRGSSLGGAGDSHLSMDLPDQTLDLAVNEAHSPVNDSFQDIPGSKLIWQIDPRPDYCSKYYCFSLFAMGLNELESHMEGVLAPTDCRFRPDIRALEDGDLDRASSEKNRLEEKQRAARKSSKRGHDDWTPLWFQYRKNPTTGFEDWLFTDRYWNRGFSTCPDLY